MSDYVIQGQTLTGIADAIRAQLGTEQQYTPESMAAAIGSIQGGGGDELLNAVLDGSISGDFRSSISKITVYAMYNRSKLTRAFLPQCTYFDQFALQRCSNLVYLYAPVLETLSNYCLGACTSLKYLDLPSVTNISYQAFLNSSSLVALILRSQSICTLSNSTNFDGTPIKSGAGFVYVPDNLVEQYKVSTNWSTLASQIKGLSEIPDDVKAWLDEQEAA